MQPQYIPITLSYLQKCNIENYGFSKNIVQIPFTKFSLKNDSSIFFGFISIHPFSIL